jgi:hypothetical protein
MSTYKRRADLKVYLEIFLSLITISTFAVFALRPTLLTIAELIKEIEIKREILAKMDNKIQNLSKAQSLFDRERQKIRLLETAMPEKPSPEDFARQIEGLSVKHQINISDITVDKVLILGKESPVPAEGEKEKIVLPEGAREMIFSIKVSTTIDRYAPLIDLLSDLEELRNPIKIDSVSFLSEEDKAEGTKQLVLVLDGILPYFKMSDDNINQNQ